MELPWFLGGDEKKAQEYLERAIAADGNFTNARLLVANLYKKQGRVDDAKRQLEAVIRAENPHYRFAWERIYKPEAERLLKTLDRNPVPPRLNDVTAPLRCTSSSHPITNASVWLKIM